MCVASLLCGPRAVLWLFYGFLCEQFSLYKKKGLLYRKKTVHIKNLWRNMQFHLPVFMIAYCLIF